MHRSSLFSRSIRMFIAAMLASILAACTAPAPQTGSAPPAAETPPQAASPTPMPTPAPVGAEAPPAQAGAPGDLDAPDRSCRSDSDCAVKDVGNCCGYFPMCVNKNARTDPAAVRAACEKSGMASICGFQDVKGCSCVQGRCENLSTDTPVVM